jgi:hypothetical protein
VKVILAGIALLAFVLVALSVNLVAALILFGLFAFWGVLAYYDTP